MMGCIYTQNTAVTFLLQTAIVFWKIALGMAKIASSQRRDN
jgi:hypothetical protein